MSHCCCVTTVVLLVSLRSLFIFVLCVILCYFGWLGYFYSLAGRHVIPFVFVRQCSSIKFWWILWIKAINRTIWIGIRLIRLRIYDYATWRYTGYTGNRPHHRLIIRFRRSEILTRYLGMTAGHGCHRGWRRRRRYRGIAALALRFIAATRRT